MKKSTAIKRLKISKAADVDVIQRELRKMEGKHCFNASPKYATPDVGDCDGPRDWKDAIVILTTSKEERLYHRLQ